MTKNIRAKWATFDAITEFRLINAYLVAIAMNLFFPILTDLKGEYLAAWVISLMMIGGTLMVKTNQYFVDNFSMGQLFKMGIVVHVLFVTSALIYFWNPLWMVLMDGIVSLVEIAVFSAYSIKLNNYLTNNFPTRMSEFQIVKNNNWADGTLIGLSAITVITYTTGIVGGLVAFIIYNILFSGWMLYNWNFFDKYE